jgi:ketosteroid isomerase-like protein
MFPPIRKTRCIASSLLTAAAAAAMAVSVAMGATADDERAVAELDRLYQAAVEKNDAATMDRILHDDFVLVTGRGTVYNKTQLLTEARKGDTQYERQVEIEGTQKVRVWGDTAVVTALLWLKGTSEGKAFEHKVWFSDTYVRTPTGWRYAFGQASLPLPKER